jgi:predicted secreted protein
MSNVTAATFTFLGGQFQLGDGGTPTENFTTISQVKSVDFGSSKVQTEEVTSADNTDSARRYVSTLYDAGDVSIEVIWNPSDATHVSLRTAFMARGQHNFKVVNPASLGTYTFAGIITSFDVKEHIDKPADLSVKVKISGALAYA